MGIQDLFNVLLTIYKFIDPLILPILLLLLILVAFSDDSNVRKDKDK